MGKEGSINWKVTDSFDTLLDGYNCSEKTTALSPYGRKLLVQTLSVLLKTMCCLKLLSGGNHTGKDLSPFGFGNGLQAHSCLCS